MHIHCITASFSLKPDSICMLAPSLHTCRESKDPLVVSLQVRLCLLQLFVLFGRWCMWYSFQSLALPCSSLLGHSSMSPLYTCSMNWLKATQLRETAEEQVAQTNSVIWNWSCSQAEPSYLSLLAFFILISLWHAGSSHSFSRTSFSQWFSFM